LDDVPAWEQREVAVHYEPEHNQLNTSFLSAPIPLQEAINRRKQGEPLEYILRHCHIDRITLKTDSRALIPRPETETMVRRFVERLDMLPPGPIVDCGTGSGFMAGWLSTRTDREIVATDFQKEPLSLARENRERSGWSFSLVRADRLCPIRSLAGAVINLPYVNSDSERLSTSVRDHEPHGALFPDEDLRSFYRELLHQVDEKLLTSGEVWLEGDEHLFEQLRTAGILKEISLKSSIFSDTYNRPRFLVLRA